MKFDFIIGNPPYQEESSGDQKTFQPATYHNFMDAVYEVGGGVELIHPARFLFNAGSTPKSWNQKMLHDPHFRVLRYESDASAFFPNVEIKGGVAITYHDTNKDYGAIEVFSPFPEMNSIRRKASPDNEADSITRIAYNQLKFDLAELFRQRPDVMPSIGSGGKDARLEKNIFVKTPVFSCIPKSTQDIRVLGIVEQKRAWRYVSREIIDENHPNLQKYKVVLPCTNGNGDLGETLSSPLVMPPNESYTRSFIGIGAFDDVLEADNALKYIKTKFARTMLHLLKITQMNNRETWRLVPLQDFTDSSDIDWSRSVAEIDQQLYEKYGFSQEEIAFIETHVKEMA